MCKSKELMETFDKMYKESQKKKKMLQVAKSEGREGTYLKKMKDELKVLEKEVAEMEKKVIALIDLLPSGKGKDYLIYHFLIGKTYVDIAAEKGITDRHVSRVVNKAFVTIDATTGGEL